MPGLVPDIHGSDSAIRVDGRIKSGHDDMGDRGSIRQVQPRRMTIADPVAGLAQPRLALTSTFLTWRQPPSL